MADLEGVVHGFTTPSATGVSVIGGSPDDTALNVAIEGKGALWFRPDLLERVHRNEGLELRIGKVTMIKRPDGSWEKKVKA